MLMGIAKPMPLRAAAADGGVHPDDLAPQVEERAAGVARVDGGVGLEEVVVAGSGRGGTSSLVRPLALMMPALTVCESPNGLPMATTQSPTSMASESPSGKRPEVLGVDAHDGDVRRRVGPDDLRGEGPLVRELHLDRLAPFDDMVVREDDPGACR